MGESMHVRNNRVSRQALYLLHQDSIPGPGSAMCCEYRPKKKKIFNKKYEDQVPFLLILAVIKESEEFPNGLAVNDSEIRCCHYYALGST